MQQPYPFLYQHGKEWMPTHIRWEPIKQYKPAINDIVLVRRVPSGDPLHLWIGYVAGFDPTERNAAIVRLFGDANTYDLAPGEYLFEYVGRPTDA